MRKAFLKKGKAPPQVFSLIVSICSGAWPLVTLWGFTLPWEKQYQHLSTSYKTLDSLPPSSLSLPSGSSHTPSRDNSPQVSFIPPWVCTFDFSLLVWHVSLLGLANSLSFKCLSRGHSTLKPLHALLVKENHFLLYVSIEFSFLYSFILSRNIY